LSSPKRHKVRQGSNIIWIKTPKGGERGVRFCGLRGNLLRFVHKILIQYRKLVWKDTLKVLQSHLKYPSRT
jgi:hypothetical protein